MKFADPYCGIQFSLLPQQKPTASPIRNDMPVKMRMTAICCMVHCLRGFIYMISVCGLGMDIAWFCLENLKRISTLRGMKSLPLFSDFTNRKTPENLINRTSGVFSSMRITGLEPARLLTIEPKSIASANSAISACQTKFYYTYACFLIITPGVQKVNTRYFCPHGKRTFL